MSKAEVSTPRLILHPKYINDAPEDISILISLLTDINLISGAQDNSQHYLPGNEFIQLITFLGCSPEINLSPEDGDKYCYITISDIASDAQCLGHTATVKPKCPKCRAKLDNWQQVENWQSAKTHINCNKCGETFPMHKLKWRQEAGYARFIISVANIHPHEAVPSENLLIALERLTGFEWNYCYVTNSLQENLKTEP